MIIFFVLFNYYIIYKFCNVGKDAANKNKLQTHVNDEYSNGKEDLNRDDFWQTSIGELQFTIEELPEQLQYIYKLLKV